MYLFIEVGKYRFKIMGAKRLDVIFILC